MEDSQKLMREYNVKALASIHLDQDTDIFFSIISNIILEEIDSAANLFKRNQSLLEQKKWINFFKHVLLFSRGIDDQDVLVSSLSDDTHFKEIPSVYGIYTFYHGFYFLRLKNFGLASAFYKKALIFFNESDQASWVWRTKFNILLCVSYKNNFSNFDVLYEELMDSWGALPKSAKESFVVFLVWLHLFRGNYDEAFALCAQFQIDPKMSDYLAYLNFVLKKKNIENEDIELSDFKKILFKITREKITFSQIEDEISMMHTRDKFLVFHAYLVNLYRTNDYRSVIDHIEKYSLSYQDQGTLIIQPFSTLELMALSAAQLQEDKLKEETLMKIKISEPHWIYRSCVKKCYNLEKKRCSVVVRYIEEKSLIEVGEKRIDASKMKKISILLNLLSLNIKQRSIVKIVNTIYPQENKPEEGVAKLLSLLYRIKKMIGLDFFAIDGDHLNLAETVSFVTIKKRGAKMRSDELIILHAIKNKSSDGATANDLSTTLKLSRRTITSKLQILLKQDLIYKIGSGPNIRYQVARKNK